MQMMENNTEVYHTQKQTEQVEKSQQTKTKQKQTLQRVRKNLKKGKKTFFNGIENVSTEQIISLINTKEFNFNFSNINHNTSSDAGKDRFGKYIPLEEILKNSLRLDGIKSNETEKIERYAKKCVNRFFRELLYMMLEANCLFCIPRKKLLYLFITDKNIFLKKANVLNNTIKLDNIFIKDILIPFSITVPIHTYLTGHSINLKVKQTIKSGRIFLTYKDYYDYIKSKLPYNKKIKTKFESKLAIEVGLKEKAKKRKKKQKSRYIRKTKKKRKVHVRRNLIEQKEDIINNNE